MNCTTFKDRLYEYVEGSLAEHEQTAAAKHLAGCAVCRAAVRREQHAGQFLSEGLHQSVEAMTLSAEMRRRILAAAERQSAPSVRGEFLAGLWNILTRRTVIATSFAVAIVLLGFHFISDKPTHGVLTTQAGQTDDPNAVSIQVSYRVPVTRFHQEGNLVTDTLAYETIVTSETLGGDRESSVR